MNTCVKMNLKCILVLVGIICLSDAVSKNQFRNFITGLWDIDVNRVGNVVVSFQSKSNIEKDASPKPLLKISDDSFFKKPTYKLFKRLLNNFKRDYAIEEIQTQTDIKEEKEFIEEICKTDVMQTTYKFLHERALYNGSKTEFEKYLIEIWFGLYPRKPGGPKSSSGFEHVFIGEYKKNTVSGLHNWVQYLMEEKKNNVDYKGFYDYRFLGKNVTILTNAFIWNGKRKQKGGMFIGTSLEFEMALYTACFLFRPNAACSIKINGVYISIITYTFYYRDVSYVATAFPVII